MPQDPNYSPLFGHQSRILCAIFFAIITTGCSAGNVTGGAAGSTPWLEGADAPEIAGVRLGDSQAVVVEELGSPDLQGDLDGGAVELFYSGLGLILVVTPDQGTALIGLLTRLSPQVQGVRVGDSVAHMKKTWGSPYNESRDRATYTISDWVVLVHYEQVEDSPRIKTITFGWSTP